MSNAEDKDIVNGKGAEKAASPEKVPSAPKITYSVSQGLSQWMARHGVSLALSSYQSGFLYFIGRNPRGGINIHQTVLPKPMGLCMNGDELIMTGGAHVMRFRNALERGHMVNGLFDACYVPRLVHVTGGLHAHDVGVDAEDEVVFVNTRFNCLAKVSAKYSFEEVWRPPFITELVDEDRCHLNGMAMREGRPAYVTAVSRSNTIDGWRDRRHDGGIVIDVESGEIVCEGLSMPHSPRLRGNELWLLNSGTGELGTVSLNEGTFSPRVFCPGFLRGLTFLKNFAIVGLSRPRYERFEGLDLDRRLEEADSEAWCGIQIIDLDKGSCVEWFRIDGVVGEVYDVEVIPDVVCPMSLSPFSREAAALITYEGMPAINPQLQEEKQEEGVSE